MAPSSRNKPAKAKTVTPSAAKSAAKTSAKPAAKAKPAEAAAKRPAAKAEPAKPASAKSAPVKPAPAKPPAAKAAAPVKATTSKAPPAKPAPKTTASKPSPVTSKPAPAKAGTTTPAPSSKATLPPVTKSKAPEAKSPVKPAAEKASTAAKVEKPAPAPVAAPPPPEPETAPAAARPAIVVAAPPNMPIRNASNPMSPRPPMGRPNMPPSFAVRSPGRPGFAEGQATPPRPPGPKVEFKAGDHVVYPTHGVGTVQGIEVIEVAGTDHHMIVVTFDENRMTLRVPVNKVPTAGLRKLFTQKEFEAAIDTLKGRARIKRTMWSRRAQEYEAKINSGDPIQIAEVVRDLQRNAGQPDQSFSERQIYEQALERLAAEYAAIEKIDKLTASERLVVFAKST